MSGAIFVHSTLDDAGLSPAAFRVLGHLSRRAGKDGRAFPSVPSMAATCRLNKQTVWRALSELEQRGWVRRESNPGRVNSYFVTEPDRKGDPGLNPGRVGIGPPVDETEVRHPTGSEDRHPTEKEGHEGTPGRFSKESDPKKGIHLAPAAADAQHDVPLELESTPTERPKARTRSPMFDALARACGSLPDEMTTAAARACGVALADILRVMPNVQPAEFARRADIYRFHFSTAALTPSALAKHWAQCNEAPRRVNPHQTRTPTAEDHERGFFHGTEFEGREKRA